MIALVRDSFVSDAYTQGMVDQFAVYVVLGALFFATAITCAYVLDRQGRRIDAMIVAAVLSLVAGSVTASGYEALSASTSTRTLAVSYTHLDVYKGQG